VHARQLVATEVGFRIKIAAQEYKNAKISQNLLLNV
jgi:hypothetical protein